MQKLRSKVKGHARHKVQECVPCEPVLRVAKERVERCGNLVAVVQEQHERLGHGHNTRMECVKW